MDKVILSSVLNESGMMHNFILEERKVKACMHEQLGSEKRIGEKNLIEEIRLG